MLQSADEPANAAPAAATSAALDAAAHMPAGRDSMRAQTPSSAQWPGKAGWQAGLERARELHALKRLGEQMTESFDAVAGAVAEGDAVARLAADTDRLRIAV